MPDPAAARRPPKYLRICDALQAAIEAGVHPPGAPLPSQRALAERFGVTLMTVRQAVGVLEREGLLSTRQGSGTFVAARPFAYRLGPLRSLAREIAAAGGDLATRVLGASLTAAPPGVAERLRLDGAEVFVVDRLRLLDGEPLLVQASYLPPHVGLRLATATLEVRSLYDALAEDAGVTVARASETIRSVGLGASEAALLGREPDSPALLSRRLTFDGADVPAVEDRAVLPGDRAVLTAERAAAGVALSYGLDAGDVRKPGRAWRDFRSEPPARAR